MSVLGENPTQIIVLFSAFILFRIDHADAQGDPIAEANQFPCFNFENYTSSSSFETNLNILLSSLVSNGSEDGYLSTSFGVNPDIAYGLVQCRGDISPIFCRSCLMNSTVELIKRCPNRKVAVLRYDHCILHYSNAQFFSQVDTLAKSEYKPEQVSEADVGRFDEQVRSLLTNVSEAAASRPNKFGYGNASYTPLGKRVYGMVQCNKDLSPTNCTSCVQSLVSKIQDCCDKRVGAKIFTASCYLRYEQGDFATPESKVTDSNNASYYSFHFSIYLVLSLLSLLVTALQV